MTNNTLLATLSLFLGCAQARVPAPVSRGAGGDIAAAGDPSIAAGEGPVAALRDDFDEPGAGGAWTVLNGHLAEISRAGGHLVIRPLRYSVWFHEESGPGLVRRVEGDFKVTTSVRARSTAHPDEPVHTHFQFGGLIVRDPTSDAPDAPENYVFSVVGYRGDYLSAETKSTIDDLSMVDGPPWQSGDAELRICRVGADLHLFIRAVAADTWTPVITYRRDDLPRAVQVGPIAYTYTDAVDLTASFDFVAIEPVRDVSDCAHDA